MEVDKKETKAKEGATATDPKTDAAAKKEEKPVDPNKLAVADIDSNVTLVKKAVVQQEARFVQRVLRTLVRLRKRLNPIVLNEAVNKHVPAGPRRESLLKYLDNSALTVVAMDVEPKPEDSAAAAGTTSDVPEVELYLHMLVAVFLIDGNKLDSAVQCVEQLIARVVETKRRSSDLLSARAYFFYARAHELNGTGSAIRGTLQAALRTATLRCDEAGQATIINLLLRNYLNDDLIGQADFLVSKTKFPENAANNENARYSYYLGRIKAVQLDYSEAKVRLEDATRKAAQGAVGFLQSAYKLLVIVQMLLGDIPERELFRRADLKNSLAPYLQLTQSVRVGDLRRFSEVVQLFGDKFRADKTYKLILRLRHNVIKTGIRMISLSYSRISLADISKKLSLESPEDAEFIVAKAIRDGVIDATIDHKQSFLQSKEVIDLYSTHEPQDVFHQRIAFCLKIHNDAVQAMRFPPNAYRKYLETPEQRRERELQESELAEEIEKEEKEDGSF